ncbi:MAG: hypothetical protein ACOC3Z_00010 [Nanoarchaeota archaeon]
MKYKNNSKKGLSFSLETLLGVVLSVIVLFFMLQAFGSVFLANNTNLDIAKANANSIKEFVEYSSSGEYSTLTNCFNMLKLHHLENYQHEDDDGENYFYVIDSKGVNIINTDRYDKFSKNLNLKGIVKKRYEFDDDLFPNGLKLKFDETESASFLPWSSSDTKLQLEKDAKYIILIPTFSNQNNYDIYIYYYDGRSLDDDEVDGENLIFNQDEKILFVSYEDRGDLMVSRELCSYKYLIKKDYDSYFQKKPEEIDYINNEVIFKLKLKDSGEFYDIYFGWKNGPMCFENQFGIDCKVLFGEHYQNLNYDQFLEKVKEYIANNPNLNQDLELVELKDLNSNEVDLSNLVIDDFLSEDFTYTQNQMQNLAKKENNIYDVDADDVNDEFNGCRNVDECFDFSFRNGKVYFFYGEKYKSFKEYFLRKDENFQGGVTKVYFLEQEIEVKELETDKYGWFNDDGKVVYYLKIPVNGYYLDVLLSKNQYDNIPGVEK